MKAASSVTKKKKTPAKKSPAKKNSSGKTDISASYNAVKRYEGKQYTGMKIGRMHRWNYDKSEWKEKKITPEKWEFSYDAVKRRIAHAPEGSGVPVGTGYHWFILAHQFAQKLNANDYITRMVGLKFKLAHKRVGKDDWNASGRVQQKHLIKILKSIIEELEKEPEELVPVPLQFEYQKKKYSGTAVPVLSSCDEGVCFELDITLNDKHLGIIRNTEKGWKISEVKSQGLANTIGQQIALWYE